MDNSFWVSKPLFSTMWETSRPQLVLIMKAVGIVGSPRKNGNTEFLVKEALDILANEGIEVELISLRGKEIKPCDACYACEKQKKCIVKDDFDEIYNKMAAADAIIVGSPVYYGSATAETMALLARAGVVAGQTGKIFSRKIGGPITVARRAGHNFTYAQLLFWFMINDFIVPGSSYWNVALAGAGGKRDIIEDEEGIRVIRHFGKNIAWLLKKLR